ncbi:MAG: proline dehydrogenase family protein [Mycobacteriaceae bacterium]
MPNAVLLAAARSPRTRRLVSSAAVTRKVVDRFVAGEQVSDAFAAARRLVDLGLTVSLDHLGEGTRTVEQIRGVVRVYEALLDELGERGLARSVEVSLKLSSLGQALPVDGDRVAVDAARQVCAAAARVGTTVTVDMEDHTTVDSTLHVVNELRADYPWVGAVLQSCLYRTEQDCRELTHSGSRVRLVKGAYAEPASVAHRGKGAVDAAYVRCLQTLMAGEGYPMIGSHDPALIARAEQLAQESGRTARSYEFQMLYGIRVGEQHRLAASGHQMRVYVPYGADWYGYFMRRLAERPANVLFFLRSFISH